MARVTVEDCILHVPNRFELVLFAAHRAKQIASGNPITVERDNDKDGVVSLREIADETIPVSQLREETVNAMCKRQQVDIADKQAVEEDEMHMDVAQAFQEAAAHAGKTAEEEVEAEDSGMSFEGDDVAGED